MTMRGKSGASHESWQRPRVFVSFTFNYVARTRLMPSTVDVTQPCAVRHRTASSTTSLPTVLRRAKCTRPHNDPRDQGCCRRLQRGALIAVRLRSCLRHTTRRQATNAAFNT